MQSGHRREGISNLAAIPRGPRASSDLTPHTRRILHLTAEFRTLRVNPGGRCGPLAVLPPCRAGHGTAAEQVGHLDYASELIRFCETCTWSFAGDVSGQG
jgi:hypothetical protein